MSEPVIEIKYSVKVVSIYVGILFFSAAYESNSFSSILCICQISVIDLILEND